MKYTTGVAALILLTTVTVAAEPAQKPNIIFILADDLGWGDLGCYGNKFIPTPNLDKLAKQGTLFTHFYVGGSVCSPSRTAFITGQFPGRHAIHGHFATVELNKSRGMPNFLDPKTPTLPGALKKAGYATGHVGKWHLGGSPDAPPPEDYGFDFVKATTSNKDTWKEQNNDPFFRAKSSALFVDEGIKFIDASKDKPFYLQIWMLVPHATLNPTAEQLKPFEKFDPMNPAAGGHKSARSIFYASVADLDTQVGRLMKQLDDKGLAENTIVIFSSDNGPEEIFIRNAGHSGVGSPGPFRGRKRSLYEGGIRVPFIVRWPAGMKGGKVDDTSVMSGADLMPTLCSIVGAKVPDGHVPDGEDRSTVIRGTPSARTKPLTWEWRFNIAGHVSNISPILAIRDGKWKLLFNPDGSRTELYDIPADPGELKEVSDKNPDVVGRMKKHALDWQKTLPKGPFDKGAGSNAYPWPR